MVLSALIASCHQGQAYSNHQPYFHAAKLTSIKPENYYTVTREFAGYITSSQQGDIGFELSGKLSAIIVDVGDRVRAGDLLATLDTELLAIERRQLNAQREEFEARLQLNQSSLKRQESLEKDGYASQQRLDELLAEQDSINAGLTRLAAALESIETRIKKSTLRAPYSGVVSTRHVDIGMVLNAGTPVIKLINDTKMEARIGVPGHLLPKLPPGSQQRLMIGDKLENSQVIAIGADTSRITRTVPIRLSVPTATVSVQGALVRLQIRERIHTPGYWVPLSALTDGTRGLWTIYAAIPEQQKSDGEQLFRTEARAVQIEHTAEERAYITADLHDIEWYIEDGLHRLVPGQQLRSSADVEMKSR